jgi:hypothetical protein
MFFVTIAAISGYVPLISKGRFGLRTLLIATTVIAILLGLVSYIARNLLRI